MFESLKIHPECLCDAVTEIAAEATRPYASVLKLHFRIFGDAGDLRLPEAKPAARTNALWRHTCFEAFVRAGSNAGYVELNVASSFEWAAYEFDAYRKGMRPSRDIDAPVVEIHRQDFGFELQATFDLGPRVPPDAAWRLALSTVIEETNGRLSYWALAHPPGKPDFHHKDCFMLELAAPSAP